MDLRDLINKLDALSEDTATDLKWDFAHKKEHLFSLLQKLRDLANKGSLGQPPSAALSTGGTASAPQLDTLAQQPGVTARATAGPNGSMTYTNAPRGEFLPPSTSSPENIQALRNKAAELTKSGDSARAKIYTDTANRLSKKDKVQESCIAKELIESFNYTYLEEQSFIKKIGGKLLFPLAVATEIWDAWTKIKELPDNMTTEKKKIETAKIIGEQITRFGVFTVGAAFGAILGGMVGGPTALVTGIAGGIAAEYKFGNDADKLVNWIVSQIYNEDLENSTELDIQPGSTDLDTLDDLEINLDNLMMSVTKEVQTNLENAGFSVGKHGVDGKFGPDTLAAFKLYKESIKADSDISALLNLVNVEEEVVRESVNISITDDLAKLRDKISKIEEIRIPRAKVRPRKRSPSQIRSSPIPSPASSAKEPLWQKIKSGLSTKSQNIKQAFNTLGKNSAKFGKFWRFTKFSALIGALAAAGYYLWNNNGDLTAPEPGVGASTTPVPDQTAPSPGAGGQTGAVCRPEVEELVNQIHLAILQLKMFQDSTIVSDAKKAIDHAEKTLQLYAPGC